MIRSTIPTASALSRLAFAALLSIGGAISGAAAQDAIMLERIGAVRFVSKAEGYAVDPALRSEIFRLQGRRVSTEEASLMARPDVAQAQH